MSLPAYRKRQLLRRTLQRAIDERRAGKLTDEQLMAVTRGTAQLLDEEALPPLRPLQVEPQEPN